jgi:hypothetical protein
MLVIILVGFLNMAYILFRYAFSYASIVENKKILPEEALEKSYRATT